MSSPSTEMTVHEGAPRTTAIMRPMVTAAAMIEAHKEVAELITKALKDGTDYGVIPGTDKPSLLKPGAERLCKAFGTTPRYVIEQQEVNHDHAVPWTKRKKKWRNSFRGDKAYDWIEETGTSYGMYRYLVRCQITTIDGVVVGESLGSCSTFESKYVDRPRDCENTALKMAQKRALVGAVLNAFGLSDRFTQDEEDQAEVVHEEWAPPPSDVPDDVIRLPGNASSWGGYGGSPLAEVRDNALKQFVKWVEGDPERQGKFARASAEAIRILEDRAAGRAAQPERKGDAAE